MSDLLLASTNLSTRAINLLARNGIMTLSQLEEYPENALRSMRGLGGKTLDEIVAFRNSPEDFQKSEKFSLPEEMFDIQLTPEVLDSLSCHKIAEIDMSARAFHYLSVMGCNTIAQLVVLKRRDFQKVANLGEKTISVIEEATKKWLLKNGYYGESSAIQNTDTENSTNTIFGRAITSEMRTSLSFYNVSELNLSCRAVNALIRKNYTTLDKIAELSIPNLAAIKGIGLNTVNDIVTETRNWLTTNGYYKSKSFNISDEEKKLFEKLHSIFLLFLPMDSLRLLDTCRNEEMYSSLIVSYTGDITESVISDFLEIGFVRNSIEDWLKRLSAGRSEGTDSLPKDVFIEEIYSGVDEQYIQLVLDCIKKSGIFEEHYDTILIPRKTLSEYIYELDNSNDTKKKILADRLHGTTLQDVGEKYGLTRERVRQITVKQIQNLPYLFEDYYADAFKKYLLGKDVFKAMFPETIPETHQYLSMRYKKGHAIPEYESGEDFQGAFAERVRCFLKTLKIKEHLTRAEAITHVLRHECSELVSFEQFQNKYNEYIARLDVPPEKYALNWRSLANRLRLQKNLFFEADGRFRYVEFDSKKINELKRLIDFRRYKNTVISCEAIYRDYEEQLEDLDIQNGYELFCCLKTYDENEINPLLKLSAQYPFDIIFRRIPVIIIGEASEEEQVTALLKELSPIGYSDFWEAYEERFGVKKESAIANLGGYATPYLINGTYIAKAPKLNQYDSITIGSKLKQKEFWFIEELEELWKNFGRRSSMDSLNAATLKTLGYLMFSAGYAYSNQYNSMRDYLYDVQIKDGEVFKLGKLDKRLLRLSAFQSCLQKEEAGLRLFEIAPKEYVKDCYLYEQCGITRADVIEFQQQVRSLCIEKYFNAHSIWNKIREWPFVKAVGYNEWLCNSLIHQIQGFSAVYFVGNYVLSSTNDTLSIPLICKWIVDNSEKMTLLNLTDKFNDIFGTQITKWKIADKLRSSGLWNRLITDEIDSYIDSLADNSDFDVDSLLDEEFF